MSENINKVEEVLLCNQAKMFLNSISHVKYLLNDEIKEVQLLKTYINKNKVKIYVYFDDSIEGKLKNISLIDKNGNTIDIIDKETIKKSIKGFYIVFSYEFRKEKINE